MDIVFNKLQYSDRSLSLIEAIDRRTLTLDGAMGTMIQRYEFSEADFRGQRFADWSCPLKGCNDILCLSDPTSVRAIHKSYLESGVDIIETNSFNANAISLADYGLQDHVTEINLAAASIARQAADEYMLRTCSANVWVAGSVGPTSKSLSMALDGDNSVDWDTLVATYIDQCSALIDGGVDALLIETIFDTLNAKAAGYAARRAMEMKGRRVPLMLSVTLTESGRTLSGQTLEAFVASVAHLEPVSIGLNCGFGAEGMSRYIDALQHYPIAISAYPNAGLPNEMGQYDETPEKMIAQLRPMLISRKLNIVGGCCGTTPDHTAEIAKAAAATATRPIPQAPETLTLAGLEPLEVSPERNFLNIGERCNVAGSRKFLRLIKEGSIDEAVEIARSQVEAGAQVIDINMDDAMLDAPKEMAAFISRLAVEPDVARVPLMIDSSDWRAIETALKHVQGRPIVNSISLKEGEATFLAHARTIREMGAAVVVMAFDEQGQADTYERRIEVCSRAYRLLVDEVGFRGCDIIFDPNVLAIATGIEVHNDYAVDFIRATRWIKENLPGAKVSGGVSNLSFSFRGNNYVREAMHALFLYHAGKAGLDMAIVNAAAIIPVDEIPADLREAVDDALLNRRPDATERLVEIAERIKAERAGDRPSAKPVEDESLTASQRIERMLIKGQTDGMDTYLPDAMSEQGSAVGVIDGPLMDGMNKIGRLFGEGKMFLPQVVKSARAMKHAVAWLTPYIEQEKQATGGASAGKMVIATVKGDVHDIGKNIVAVIMNCNGYEIIDMGVMVPGNDIVERAIATQADFIGLSGLITPSLDEMCHVARLMEEKGLQIPLLIGGATTSALHTAVKIAPCYSGPVVFTRDAAMLPVLAQQLLNPDTRDSAIAELRASQQQLRDNYYNASRQRLTPDEARSRSTVQPAAVVVPKQPGIHTFPISIAEARQLINWRAFFAAWKLDASLAKDDVCDCCNAKAAEARRLRDDATEALDYLQQTITDDGIIARIALLPAGRHDDNIIYRHDGSDYTLPTPRQLAPDSDCLALADYISPITDDGILPDWIGLFAVTTGSAIERIIAQAKADGDDYRAILFQSLADRLAEAATELAHSHVRQDLWGYETEPQANPDNLLRQHYQGIRPAIGYPSLPDQSLVFLADKVLRYGDLGISLTENGAMQPSASTSGYLFAHPDSHYFIVDRY